MSFLQSHGTSTNCSHPSFFDHGTCATISFGFQCACVQPGSRKWSVPWRPVDSWGPNESFKSWRYSWGAPTLSGKSSELFLKCSQNHSKSSSNHPKPLTPYQDFTSDVLPPPESAKPPGNSGWCAPSRCHDWPAVEASAYGGDFSGDLCRAPQGFRMRPMP